MTITIANGNDWKQAAATSVQFENNVTAGNRMACVVQQEAAGEILTVSDGTNSWEEHGQVDSPGDSLMPVAIFSFIATAGQNGTKPTATVSGGSGGALIAIIEYAGADPVTALDGTPFETTGAGATAGGNITMTVPGGAGVLVAGHYNADEMSSDGITLVATAGVGTQNISYGSAMLSEEGVIPVTFAFDIAEAGDWWAVGVIFKAAEEEEEEGAPIGRHRKFRTRRHRSDYRPH